MAGAGQMDEGGMEAGRQRGWGCGGRWWQEGGGRYVGQRAGEGEREGGIRLRPASLVEGKGFPWGNAVRDTIPGTMPSFPLFPEFPPPDMSHLHDAMPKMMPDYHH